MNQSSQSTGPQLSAEQRGRSRRNERSISRERTPQHSSSHDIDESSATVDPQNRVSDRSRSPQEQEGSRRHDPSPQRHDPSQERGKKTVAEKQPNEPPKAKKHTSIESDEDDEEPRNEPGTSSNTQPTVQRYFLVILMMKTVITVMNTVHEVWILEGQYSTQILMF